jgi:hypothetical protein
MKTSDLINLLASDGGTRLRPAYAVLLAAASSLAVAALMFGLFLDLRPDIWAAMTSAPFLLKLVLAGALALTGLGMLLRLMRPEGLVGRWKFGLLGSMALLAAAVALELLSVPQSYWLARSIGIKPLVCLASIVALSILPLFAFQYLLRSGAPGDPGKAGAASGLAAASIATAVYVAHCPNDSPLFVLVWYTAALLIVSLAGFQLGKRLLVW